MMQGSGPLYGDSLVDLSGSGSTDHYIDSEQQLLERRLKQQLRESEEDSKWLQEEETNLRPLLSLDGVSSGYTLSSPGHTMATQWPARFCITTWCLHNTYITLYTRAPVAGVANAARPILGLRKKRLSLAQSLSDSESVEGDLPSPTAPTPTLATTRSDSLDSRGSQATGSDDRIIVVKKMEPTPTADLDRSNDRVYDCTTCVVKAVMALSQGVQQSQASQYLQLVRKVGLELRDLLTSVDTLVPLFPSTAHKEVEMAHQVLSKDMSELVNTMKLAQQYSTTTLDGTYRK
ncbi:putative serine/threonine protein phosphatase [Homalodisca vitripennis]|nr:putative serine/threonine protein phosphatase [Homalodisca vitripennis]